MFWYTTTFLATEVGFVDGESTAWGLANEEWSGLFSLFGSAKPWHRTFAADLRRICIFNEERVSLNRSVCSKLWPLNSPYVVRASAVVLIRTPSMDHQTRLRNRSKQIMIREIIGKGMLSIYSVYLITCRSVSLEMQSSLKQKWRFVCWFWFSDN